MDCTLKVGQNISEWLAGTPTPGNGRKGLAINILDKLPIESGAIYIMDRGYLDYARLYKLHQSAAYFVTRAKNNARYHRRYYQKIDKSSGLKSDQIITRHGYYSKKDYPERLRRVAYYDEKKNKILVFLTNNFTLPALTITEIYRKRWQIELFFKWIKQHLRIKTFLRHIRECGQNTNLDFYLRLCTGCKHQETVESGAESLYNFMMSPLILTIPMFSPLNIIKNYP